MIKNLIKSLSAIPEVQGIVYGGSRGLGIHHALSDYDVVVYFDQDTRISNETLIKNIPDCFTINNTPALVSGVCEDIKFEIFQKNLKTINSEIDNNLQGRFNWRLAPLFPYGDLSYRQVSHLVNYELLVDKNGLLKQAIDKVTPFPKLLKQSIMTNFLKQLNLSLMHLEKVKKSEDLYHFMSLVGFVFFCSINVIYAVNNKYPLIEKGNVQVLNSLQSVPKNLAERFAQVYASASAFDFHNALILLKTLIAELKQHIHEDQKKQNQ